jgi:transcriptional regulator with XRE-family HTH domain
MASVQPQSFGELLRRYRIAAGLTQEQLAEQARLSARGIGALETGARRAPRKDTVAMLAKALGLAPAEHALLESAARQRLARIQVQTGVAMRTPEPSLPIPPTALLGREETVRRVRRLIGRDGVRLLPLTGPASARLASP